MAEDGLVAKNGEGKKYSIGTTEFELRATSEELGDNFALLEFAGREGPWTVPHVHRTGRESFYIVEGRFVFSVAGVEHSVGPGDFVSVPPGAVHTFRAETGGGRVLVLTPPHLEAMFVEMSTLGPEALTDPEVRKGLAARHDSVPS